MTIAASPFRPKRLSGDPESWNILIGFAGQPLPLAKPSAVAAFELSEAPSEDVIAVAFRGARGPRLAAVFEQAPLEALFGAQLDMRDVAGLPPHLRAALLRGLLALVWDALPEHHLGLCAVDGVGSLRELGFDEQADWFSFQIEGLAPEPISGRLGCAQGALATSLLSGAIAPTRIDQTLRQKLFADVFISLERLRLRVSETRGLKCGDIVMLAESAGSRLLLRAARVSWEAVPDEDGLRIAAVSWSGGKDQDGSETVDVPEAEDGLDVSKLIIDVDFDIGRVSKSLAEIESWRPGSVIELEPPEISEGLEVTLRVNGAPIGVGDLILIDERIAVRIGRWTP